MKNEPDIEASESSPAKVRSPLRPLWPIVLPILFGICLTVWEGFRMLEYIEICSGPLVSCAPPLRALLWLGFFLIVGWCVLWGLCTACVRRWCRSGIFFAMAGTAMALVLSGAIFSAYKILVMLGF